MASRFEKKIDHEFTAPFLFSWLSPHACMNAVDSMGHEVHMCGFHLQTSEDIFE